MQSPVQISVLISIALPNSYPLNVHKTTEKSLCEISQIKPCGHFLTNRTETLKWRTFVTDRLLAAWRYSGYRIRLLNTYARPRNGVRVSRVRLWARFYSASARTKRILYASYNFRCHTQKQKMFFIACACLRGICRSSLFILPETNPFPCTLKAEKHNVQSHTITLMPRIITN